MDSHGMYVNGYGTSVTNYRVLVENHGASVNDYGTSV